MKPFIILIICRGNIARSPTATEILNRKLKQESLNDKYIAISRGTQGTSVDPEPVKFSNIKFYPDLYNQTLPMLNELDIDLSNHISSPIDEKIAKEAAIILALDNKIKEQLLTLFPDLKHKIHLITELVSSDKGIVDPEGITGEDKHREIFTQINSTILQGFPKLLELLNTSSKI